MAGLFLFACATFTGCDGGTSGNDNGVALPASDEAHYPFRNYSKFTNGGGGKTVTIVNRSTLTISSTYSSSTETYTYSYSYNQDGLFMVCIKEEYDDGQHYDVNYPDSFEKKFIERYEPNWIGNTLTLTPKLLSEDAPDILYSGSVVFQQTQANQVEGGIIMLENTIYDITAIDEATISAKASNGSTRTFTYKVTGNGSSLQLEITAGSKTYTLSPTYIRYQKTWTPQ